MKMKIDRRKQEDYRKKSIIILIIYERLHLFLNFYDKNSANSMDVIIAHVITQIDAWSASS